MTPYPYIIETSESGYGAYVPDLPGCVAVGETIDEIRILIREAIELHLEDVKKSGSPLPKHSIVEIAEIKA